MASKRARKSHLSQIQLKEVESIIQGLGSWLASAEFDMAPTGEIGRCAIEKDDQRTKLDGLFQALGITSKIDDQTLTYGIFRFPGPNSSRVHVGAGEWADLVPIRIIEGNPQASDKGLVIGQMVHITGRVEIKPALDCLVLTPGSKPRPKSGSKSSGSKSAKSDSKSDTKSSSA